MDSLIAGLDLPAVSLSEQQQKELDKQRALQQQKLTASLLAWFKWLFGLNGSWVCLI
jgi:hypothetical protein